MILIDSEGRKIPISDSETIKTYKNYLNNHIINYQKTLETRTLSPDEEKMLKEYMSLYNQIVDFENTYEKELEAEKEEFLRNRKK